MHDWTQLVYLAAIVSTMIHSITALPLQLKFHEKGTKHEDGKTLRLFPTGRRPSDPKDSEFSWKQRGAYHGVTYDILPQKKK